MSKWVMGPNVIKLFNRRLAQEVVPEGGGVKNALDFFLLDAPNRRVYLERTEAWVQTALKLIRQAPGDNPWREADDETIAAELLRQIEAKDKKL